MYPSNTMRVILCSKCFSGATYGFNVCLSVEFSGKVVVPYFTWHGESWSLVPTLGGPSNEFPG